MTEHLFTRSGEPCPHLNVDQAAHAVLEGAGELVRRAIHERGHDNPPFSSSQYARLLGIEVVGGNLGETSAVLLRLRGGYRIVVNQDHDSARQNFSCAHELGHVILNRMKVALVEDTEFRNFNPSRKYDPQRGWAVRQVALERLCNVAATELLMPEAVVRRYLSDRKMSIEVVGQLARDFRVSIRSATWRLSEVGQAPCVSAFWKRVPKSESLRLAWCAGPGIQLPTSAHYVPAHAIVRRPSTLHAAFDGNSSVSCYRLFRRGSEVARLLTEAKGFGLGETRFVASLSFLNAQQGVREQY